MQQGTGSLEDELSEDLVKLSLDPLGYVMYAFEWGVGELEKFSGPDKWQEDVLRLIGDLLKDGKIDTEEAIQIAIASGHGIGKSALVSWIIKWAFDTLVDTKGVVTANTEVQLKTKTWSELAKWHRLSITYHRAELTATALFSKDKKHEKTWRIDQVPWSERNTEAFAGLHNKGKRVILIFDEASAIPDLIWEVSEGALTDSDTEIIHCAFGNPTRNIGRFRECFDGGKFSHRWHHKQIDSRTVAITNKAQLQKIVEDYGDDDDVTRVRVKGTFPSASINALFGPDMVDKAMTTVYKEGMFDSFPVILGGDVARQGDDDSSLARRQGQVVFPLRVMHIPDVVLVGAQFSMEVDAHKADACFVDASGGYGVGVIDSMRATGHHPIEVYFGGKAIDKRYHDKRSEMYFLMANWIKSGGALPMDKKLREELIATTYVFQGDKFRICEKDDVKEEIGRSPDRADSVALTFAFPVVKRNPLADRQRTLDYNPYANIK